MSMEDIQYSVMVEKRSEIFLSDFHVATQLGRNSQSTGNETIIGSDPLLTPALLALVFFAYSVALVLTVLGNVAAIMVFTRGRRSRSDVRIFFINIAVVDLIVGIVCLPVSMVTSTLGWLLPEFMCPIVMFLQLTSVTTTVYMNCAMSVDRFVAVRYPLRRHVLPKCYIPAVIVAVWLASAAMSSVQLAVSRVIGHTDSQGELQCTEVWDDEHFVKYYSLIVLAVTYVIPACLIVIMYSLVCRELWKRSLPGQVDHEQEIRQINSKRKVVRLLITMASLFIASWLPLHLFFILRHFYPGTLEYLQTEKQAVAFYYPAHLLAISNSFQNPIVYGFLNGNFRSDLAELLLKFCPLIRHLPFVAKAAAAPMRLQTSICSDDGSLQRSLISAPQHRLRRFIEGSLRKIILTKATRRGDEKRLDGSGGELSESRRSSEHSSSFYSRASTTAQSPSDAQRCGCCAGGARRDSGTPPSPDAPPSSDAYDAHAPLKRAALDHKCVECGFYKMAAERSKCPRFDSSRAQLIRDPSNTEC